MADLEISQFTADTSPLAGDYVGGYKGSLAGVAGGNRRWSFSTMATYMSSALTITSAHILVGNVSNVGTDVEVSGDATLDNTGALTVASIGGKAVTLGGTFTTSGAHNLTFTITGDTTVTLPTSGTLTTLATTISTANTWSAVQTFTNSDIKLLGSSTGATTFTSANAGASNYTVTFQAATGTVALLAVAQTWGATQTYADNVITGAELKDFSETTQAVAAATTTTIDYTAGGIVLLSQDTAITTFNITNPSPTGKACKVVIIRTKDATGTARAITWPSGTIWPNGVVPTLSSTTGAVDIFTLLTTNAGTTWYGFIGGQAFA